MAIEENRDLTSVLKKWPFTIWLCLAIVLRGVLAVWRPEYDAGDFGALLVLTSGVWGFPIWLPLEVGLPASLAVFLSVLICITLDYTTRRVFLQNGQPVE